MRILFLSKLRISDSKISKLINVNISDSIFVFDKIKENELDPLDFEDISNTVDTISITNNSKYYDTYSTDDNSTRHIILKINDNVEFTEIFSTTYFENLTLENGDYFALETENEEYILLEE